MLKQVKSSELKSLRKKWYDEQDGKCPILEQEVPFEQTAMDHQHKLKDEAADETGKGIIRGCIDRNVNAFLGKIENAYKRYGLHKFVELPTLLRKLADYLDKNRIHEDIQYIHPNEAPPKKKLTKNSYKKLVKAVAGTQKVPEYKDKKNNLSKPLERLFEKYGIVPEFYK
jgi:hypothetical protein